HGREYELHRQSHLPAGHHDVVGPAHPRVVQHGHKILEIDALGVGEADHDHGLVGRGDVTGDERVAGVHGRHALEVHVRAAELRADVVHVVGHAAQDGVDHRVLAVAAMVLIAVELLDPLEVDDRHHAHHQVDVARHVHAIALVGTVQ